MSPLNWWRNHFSQSVSFGVWHLQYTGHIPNGITGCHFTKSYNVGYPLGTVFFDAITNYFVTPAILNINIDIWPTNTIRV